MLKINGFSLKPVKKGQIDPSQFSEVEEGKKVEIKLSLPCIVKKFSSFCFTIIMIDLEKIIVRYNIDYLQK